MTSGQEAARRERTIAVGMAPDPLTLTCWLDEWRDGDPDAANHLFAAAWPELSH